MTTPRTTSPARTSRLRAFALPLVMLLVLVGGLTVGLLMERHGVSYRAVQRNINNYKNHHFAAGVKECVLRWLDTARGRVDQSIDDDGLAFTINVQGEGRIDVYFRDAQGSILSDTSALSGRRREILEDMKFLIDQVEPELLPERLYRPVGPPEMSLDTLPDIALKALCLAVVSTPEKALQTATALISRRESSRSAAGDIVNVLRDLPIEEIERKEIAAMLVANPSLYEVLAETRDTSDGLLQKSSGLYRLDETRNDTFKQGGCFLTWDALPLVDDRPREGTNSRYSSQRR